MLLTIGRAYDPLLRRAAGGTLIVAQPLTLLAAERSADILCYCRYLRLSHTAAQNQVGTDGKLRQLQATLGYNFRSQQLLQQALCKDGHKLLAFLGDIAVRMLFEEHAFHAAIKAGYVNVLTPHIDTLITRQHFTAVAVHKWQLHQCLPDVDYAPSSSSSSNSGDGTSSKNSTPSTATTSSSRAERRRERKGKKALNSSSSSTIAVQHPISSRILQPISSRVGNFFRRLWWARSSRDDTAAAARAAAPAASQSSKLMVHNSSSDDTAAAARAAAPAASQSSKAMVHNRLAETAEAVIAAILLDSDYSTLRTVMHPWVASTCDTTIKAIADQAAAAAADSKATTAGSKPSAKKGAHVASTDKDLAQRQLIIDALIQQMHTDSGTDSITSAAAATAAVQGGLEQVRSSFSVTAGTADSMFSLLQQHQQQWQSLMRQLQQQQAELQQQLLQKQQELMQQQQQLQFGLLQQQQQQWCEMSLQQQQQVHQWLLQWAEEQQERQRQWQQVQQQQQQVKTYLPIPATVVHTLQHWSSAFRPLKKAAGPVAANGTLSGSYRSATFEPPPVVAAAAGAAETVKAIIITREQQEQWQQQWQEQQQQWFGSVLQGRLHTVCGFTFRDNTIAQQCSKLLWQQMVVSQEAVPFEYRHQIEVWSTMGNWLKRFAAAQHSWRVHCVRLSNGRVAAPVSAVHHTTEALNNRSHRAHMLVWMGLDPTFWCPSGGAFYNLKWDSQAERLGQCLFLLLAAVYLDGGMTAAQNVAEVLLANTPQTVTVRNSSSGKNKPIVDLSWVPKWGKCGNDK